MKRKTTMMKTDITDINIQNDSDLWTKQQFDNFTSDLSPEVRYALWTLLSDQGGWYNTFRREGSDIIIHIEECCSFVLELTLSEASVLPKNYDWTDLEPNGFSRKGNVYEIFGVAKNYFEDDSATEPFTLSFTNPKVQVEYFNATERTFENSPWETLCFICGDIIRKSNLQGDHFNPQEKELLPLIVDLAKLRFWSYILFPDNTTDTQLPELKSYFARYNHKKALSLVEKAEKYPLDHKKYQHFTRKLIALLNTQVYEPLWRELYGKISASQKVYPSQTTTYFPSDQLATVRGKIQQLMESHGFSGTYPNFTKRGEIKGVHLTNSYGLSYFITSEKNASFFVYCNEEIFGDELVVQFVSGTACLKKGETVEDIYSCTFNAKGRRLFNTIQHCSDTSDLENIEKFVNIAVKRTQLKKLSKEEKEYISKPSSLITFIVTFIFFGGFFAIGFSVLFIPVMMLLTAILDGWSMALEYLTEFPWGYIFIAAWVLAGGAMGVVTLLAERK